MKGKKTGWLGLAVFALALNVGVFLIGFSPASGQEVAVLVWPFSSASDPYPIISKAGGQVIAGSQLPYVSLARSDEADFVSALYREGALWVFDPAVLVMCGVK